MRPSPAAWTSDTSETVSVLNGGDVLNGKYLLMEPIGAGGMGQVWLARNLATGAEVAAKVLLSSRLKSEGITTKMGGGLGTSGAELTVTITSARVNGDRATLDVQITRSSNSFLGNTSSSYGASVDLVREGGSWKIDSENVVFL